MYLKYIKKIVKNKNIVMIEDEKSSLALEDGLFGEAYSIKRVFCPTISNSNKYHEILEEIIRIVYKDDLVLMAVESFSTALSYDLTALGYQVIDIGINNGC